MSPDCPEPCAGTRRSDTRTHDPTSAEAARRPVSCRGCRARHRMWTQTPGGREARMPLQDTSLQIPVDLQLLQNRKGKNKAPRTSLVAQRLRPRALRAGGSSLIPSQGTRPQMP